MAVIAHRVLFASTLGMLVVPIVAAAAPEPCAREAEGEPKRAARACYDKGQKHYDLGELVEAIDCFKKAYALSEAPRLLFNLAQAYRLHGDLEVALHTYKSFLRLEPAAPFRADVERHIKDLEARTKVVEGPEAAPAEPAAVPATSAPSVAPVAAVAAPVASRWSQPLTMTGLTAGGLGVVALGVAGYFGQQARSAEQRITAQAAAGAQWSAELESTYRRGERSERWAIGLAVGGAAALACSGLLLWLGW